MAWFGKRQSVLDRRLREIDKELDNLDAQVRRLQRAPGKASAFKPASTVYPSNRPPPAEAAQPAALPAVQPPPSQSSVSFGTPRQRELWSRHAQEEEDVSSNGEQHGWWQSLFRPRPRPLDPKLVSYLSTGSFKTVRPLRYERRMARYRFAFSFALLVGTLLLVILALRNC
ncbi:MAG: hypothetical protein NTY01_21750 [Verrucomicrobia bacterium]|nr:hypothetical protein [Verrucomicrobiota bacterium]